MDTIDKRHTLDHDPFSFHTSKDGKVFITWHRKPIMTLRGAKASKLLSQLAAANRPQIQLLLAKVTGHFKHGNEQ